MPELPEVQTVVNDLNESGIPGRKIISVQVKWPRTVNTHEPRQFIEALRGLKFLEIHRRAKYIVFGMSESLSLIVHLRMTGQFSIKAKAPNCKHTHIILELDDSRYLCFKDTRKFGRWSLVPENHMLFSKIGPEPFGDDLTPKIFYENCKDRNRQLKPLLLDQSFIAGIGNIYADEALFDSGLHPQSIASNLSKKKAAQLLASIRKVLSIGLSNMGTTLGTGAANFYSVSSRRGRNQDKLMVFRRTGEPCYICGSIIQRLIVAQRSTHVCLFCQKRRK